MNTNGGMANGGMSPRITVSVLHGGEWSASCFGRLTPGEKCPGTHWIAGWVCPVLLHHLPNENDHL